MKYIVRDRNSKKNIIIESSKTLNFFYDTLLGRIILKPFISKTFSNLMGKYMNSKYSLKRVDKFIDKNDINIYEYSKQKYTSYNDFFIRKVVESKRPINAHKNAFISPCDSKLTVYKINDDLTLKIKDSYYSVDTLVDKDIMNEYRGGYALVFRLSTDNYHRYCYIDSGTKGKNIHIDGIFHTVQPIALKHYNFYKTNTREYTILNTNNFDKVIEVEVGALGVGRIVNNHEEYKFKNEYNPVEHIKTRIKSFSSIKGKLERKGLDVTVENMIHDVHDIVGIRIVCSFLADVYEIVGILKSSKQFIVKDESDYIKNPKDSGYSSYHINLLVPVHLLDRTEYIEAEVQIRTVAMDCWASLDHKLRYKLPEELPESINSNMNLRAKEIRNLDKSMQYLHELIEDYKSNYKEEGSKD